MKLSKKQATDHAAALALLREEVLTDAQRDFVFGAFHEGARHVNSLAGAFFTPAGLARDFAIEAGTPRRVIDLCAGIGMLSHWLELGSHPSRSWIEIVCVELNPDYAAAGRKLVPQAEWIEADALDVDRLRSLGPFDLAISNPPFGRIARQRKAPRYAGEDFEYKLLDVASEIADAGVFILPQTACPFRFSGQRYYEHVVNARYMAFGEATGIVIEPGCGIDTSIYDDDWKGVSPRVEIACADFVAARERREVSRVQQALPFARPTSLERAA